MAGKVKLDNIAGTTQAAGQFDTSATAPSHNNRLNYDGHLYVTQIHCTNPNFLIYNSTFNSTTGRTVTHDLGHTNYEIAVTPIANPGGYLGEIYVTKNTNNCVIYNSGSAVTAFSLIIILTN
jgi:hypothetical protein